ncbi:putative esterase [Gordonia effusa NBRC 100432]|uniref:Putative esterase n=1 Tax=Gordonia effusa NBRC 100432 TaxID=1077974 RepID=H0R004_9ACTN|nr:serine hydrolase domain-containing protein [Gordonia effusa]GAB18405.1 putative esterase [Gordonia effusa NBRC 100432]
MASPEPAFVPEVPDVPDVNPTPAGAISPPRGVHGWVSPDFTLPARAFAVLFSRLKFGGGALCVYADGKPVMDIWAGKATADADWTHDTAGLIFSASKGISAAVLHRLADRGLLDYDAPISEYWPEFSANGKGRITVRDALAHRAGLSRLDGIVDALAHFGDLEEFERRLAAAPIGEHFGRQAYHSLTIGAIMSGIARRITGESMAALYQSEIAQPLGLQSLSLGRPTNPGAQHAAFVPALAPIMHRPSLETRLPATLERAKRMRGIGGTLRTLHVPGLEWWLADDGTPISPIYDVELPAGNAMVPAHELAKLYAALAGNGSVDGRRLLSSATARQLAPIRGTYFDRTLGVPVKFQLGYHSGPPLRSMSGSFGHVGLGGSTGWADPSRGLAAGFVHNRLPTTGFADQSAFFATLWPLIVRAARGRRIR